MASAWEIHTHTSYSHCIVAQHTHFVSKKISDDKDKTHLNSAHKAFIKLKCFLSKLRTIPVTVFQRHINVCCLDGRQFYC